MANVVLTTKQLLPAIDAIFDEVYEDWGNNLLFLTMPKRGQYEVWQGDKRVAKKIKYRKQALALIKLLKGNEENE